MFPREGEDRPRIRFKGFADAWGQRRLSDAVKRKTESGVNDSILSVEYEDIETDTGTLRCSSRLKRTLKRGIYASPQDILFGKLRPYLHNRLIADERCVAIGDFWILQPKDIDSKFLFWSLFTRPFEKRANETIGSKMPRSDWSNVSSFLLQIPEETKETESVGTLFSLLNGLIALRQRELDKLKELKKSLLERMFPSEG